MRFRRLHVAAASIAVALVHWINGSQANAADEMEKILAALKARQAKFENVCITWKETRLHPEGTVQIADALGGEPTKVPETINKYNYQLRLSGASHFRLDRRGPQWFGSRKAFMDREYFAAWDGKVGKSFYALVEGLDDGYPIGFMGDSSSDWDTRHLFPILFHLRPFNDQYAPLTSLQYMIDPDLALVGEKHCVRLIQKEKIENLTQCEFYLDPAQDYSVALCMVRRKDRLVWRLDIDYEKTLSGEILPQGWRDVSFYDDGRIRESTQASELQFSNRLKFEPSVFAPEFPTAALVTDRTGGKKAEVYLVRKDGSKRIVTSAERKGGIHYQDYLETDSGEAVR